MSLRFSLRSIFSRLKKKPATSADLTMDQSLPADVMPNVGQRGSKKDRLSYGNSITARGELRWHIFCAHTINIALLLLFVFAFYVHTQVLNRFADKGYIVYQVENGRAVVRSAADFRTTATDEEIQALALDIIALISEAGSDNIEENFARIRVRMTPAARYDFDRVLGSKIDEIKRLKIYRKFENPAIRLMDENDLLVGGTGQPSRYDIVISGRVDTYRFGTNELIASGTESYHVQLNPLPRRTIQNPSALLVSALEQINPQATEQKSNVQNALENPTATTATTAASGNAKKGAK